MAIFSKDKQYKSQLTTNDLLEIRKDLLDSLPDEAIMLIEQMIQNPQLVGDFRSIDFEREVMSIEKWIDDPYYSGVFAMSMYDELKQDLCDIINGDYFEVIMTGGLGVGKTFLGRCLIWRSLYELSCLRYPQIYYGLAPHTVISFVNMGNTLESVEKVVIQDYTPEYESIHYFKNEIKLTRKTQKVGFIFEKNLCIRPGISTEGGFIGEAVFGGLVDELNFKNSEQGIKKKQKQIKGSLSDAEKLVSALVQRMESRFKRGTIQPGRILVASSKRSDYDYTEKRAKVMANDPRVFVRDRANWEVKDPQLYSGKKFPILVGAGGIPSEVLSKERYEYFREETPSGCVILYVPVEHANAFKGHGANLDLAIRNVAGVSTVASDRFFTHKDELDEAFRVSLPHYLTYSTGLPIEGEFIYGTPLLINRDHFIIDPESNKPRKIKRHPNAIRHCHIDTSLSGDTLGLTIGHATGYENVDVSIDGDGSETERMPKIEIDISLSIQPPKRGQINFGKIRGLVYKLRDYGMPIRKITMDGFQSADMIQLFQAKGFEAELLSVDKSVQPYYDLKRAILDGRYKSNKNIVFAAELFGLEEDIVAGKIDHSVDGSKDNADSQAGVVHSITVDKPRDATVIIRSSRNYDESDDIDWVVASEMGLKGKKTSDDKILF